MAVYKKTYRPYEGSLTPSWSRMFVITRYAFEDLRRSKFLNTFYSLSFAYPVICALVVIVMTKMPGSRYSVYDMPGSSIMLPKT